MLTHSCWKHKILLQDCDYFQDSYHFLQPLWKGEQLPQHCLPLPLISWEGKGSTDCPHLGPGLSLLEHSQGRVLPPSRVRSSPSNFSQKSWVSSLYPPMICDLWQIWAACRERRVPRGACSGETQLSWGGWVFTMLYWLIFHPALSSSCCTSASRVKTTPCYCLRLCLLESKPLGSIRLHPQEPRKGFNSQECWQNRKDALLCIPAVILHHHHFAAKLWRAKNTLCHVPL